MKTLLAILLFLSIPVSGIQTISRINDYTVRAAKAYEKENYAEAITAYEYLLEDLEVKDDQLRLNLAHAYFKAGLWADAQNEYRLLADHSSAHIRSIVHLQLGNIASNGKKYAQALSLYRNALVANPENESARYNYELLKKYLELHPEKAEQDQPEPDQQQFEDDQLPPAAEENQEPQPKQNPDANGDQEEEIDAPQPDPAGQEQQKGGQSNQSRQKDKEEAAGNHPGETEGQQLNDQYDPNQKNPRGSNENAAAGDSRARTQSERQQVKISAEKAKMLLNAMRDAELQYLQQLPKKAKSKKDNSKPDW
ncbi:aerotolerance protein [Pontibacter populi]|uniref:Aerotolerance protein n=1 Tax=Pontibacter populi TaxID=890055 RepID=A0ABV1RV86_9BACT